MEDHHNRTSNLECKASASTPDVQNPFVHKLKLSFYEKIKVSKLKLVDNHCFEPLMLSLHMTCQLTITAVVMMMIPLICLAASIEQDYLCICSSKPHLSLTL